MGFGKEITQEVSIEVNFKLLLIWSSGLKIDGCSNQLHFPTAQTLIRGFLYKPSDQVLICWKIDLFGFSTETSGQQIRSKIDSFQNANFLISQPNPMMLPLIGIVSERRFQ